MLSPVHEVRDLADGDLVVRVRRQLYPVADGLGPGESSASARGIPERLSATEDTREDA